MVVGTMRGSVPIVAIFVSKVEFVEIVEPDQTHPKDVVTQRVVAAGYALLTVI